MADTLINFELPWNPAKKNQRIGRIDRLGQQSKKLSIYNLITRNSIEDRIAAGLVVKQNLFEGVLDGGNTTNFVDFTNKGRSQFIQQLEEFLLETERFAANVEESEEEQINETAPEDIINPAEEVEEPVNASTDSGEVAAENDASATDEKKATPEEIEQVMNSGMQFLSGILKMTTGKSMGVENQAIEVNKETGEVTMKFKFPM